MLTLTAEHNEDGMLTREYDCDFIVTTAGDGLWGCEIGRASCRERVYDDV